jgi:hypothetical protein
VHPDDGFRIADHHYRQACERDGRLPNPLFFNTFLKSISERGSAP